MIPEEITDSLIIFFAEHFSGKLEILSSDSLPGGCINNVCRLKTNFGDFCIKYNRRTAYPGMFESEAKGLFLLKEANEIRVPGVIHTGFGNHYSYLLLEFVSSGSPISMLMDDFGHSIARLHRHTALIISYLRKILHCYMVIYGEGTGLVAENGKACLIDPAVYYGHREIDIAMTMLFGGFDNIFYAAYQDEFPLENGWKERLEIYNLYPLLIHLNLFGSGYLGQIESIVRKY